jgi:hypothetical protein
VNNQKFEGTTTSHDCLKAKINQKVSILYLKNDPTISGSTTFINENLKSNMEDIPFVALIGAMLSLIILKLNKKDKNLKS